MPQNATTGALPAVVTIPDLPTGTTITGTELLEAVQTVGGVANSVQITINQIMTSTLGGLPVGGATGQILDKSSGSNFATQWVNVASLVTASTGLALSGSTTIALALGSTAGLSVLGVTGSATLVPAAIVGVAAQVLRVNDAGTGLAFGAVNLASAAAVTGVLPGANMTAVNLAAPGPGGVQGILPGANMSAVNLAASGAGGVQGVAGVPNGGTNTSILTAKGALFGNGTSTVGITAAGATGTVLASPGPTANPSFANLAGGGLSGGTLTNTTTLSALNVVNVAARVGSFDVWQRLNGTTTLAQVASTTAYENDGWYLITGANQAATLTQATGIATGSLYAATVQRNSAQTGTTVMRYAAPLDSDELALTQGSVVGISFTAQSGANWSPTSGTLNFAVYAGTGSVGKRGATAFTGEVAVINTSVNLVTTPTRYSAIAASAIATNASQMEIQFNWTPVGTAGSNDSFTVDDLQLEVVPSSTATVSPFVRQDMETQLARAQRFLPVVKSAGTGTAAGLGIGQVVSGTTAAVILAFHVPTRTSPTNIAISTAADFKLTTANAANTACTSMAFVGAGADFGWIQPSLGTALLTAGQATLFFTQALNAYIWFTGAEI